MKKKKTIPIEIKDIKRFSEFISLRRAINEHYDGEIPLNIYNEFLRVISNPGINSYFAMAFKPNANNLIQPNQSKLQNKKRNHQSESISNKNGIIRVNALEFSYNQSYLRPRLLYRGLETVFLGDSKWFQHDILESITRTFNVKIINYTEFSFAPAKEKQLFEKCIKKAYSKLRKEEYDKIIEKCIKLVSVEFEHKKNSYIDSCQNLPIKLSIKDFIFSEIKQVYSISLDYFKYSNLNPDSDKKLKLSFSTLSDILKKENLEMYASDIIKYLDNRFSATLSFHDIFPNFKSSHFKFKIPALFVERYLSGQSIMIIAK